jgi:hypothetical protein
MFVVEACLHEYSSERVELVNEAVLALLRKKDKFPLSVIQGNPIEIPQEDQFLKTNVSEIVAYCEPKIFLSGNWLDFVVSQIQKPRPLLRCSLIPQ